MQHSLENKTYKPNANNEAQPKLLEKFQELLNAPEKEAHLLKEFKKYCTPENMKELIETLTVDEDDDLRATAEKTMQELYQIAQHNTELQLYLVYSTARALLKQKEKLKKTHAIAKTTVQAHKELRTDAEFSERKKPKILIVHGYPLAADGTLAELAEEVCKEVVKLHDKYDHIILVGGSGWDLGDAPPNQAVKTVADVMKQKLIEFGVPESKLHADFAGYIPARTTMEEIDLLPPIFQKLGLGDPKKRKFDAISIVSHAPRIRYLLDARGAHCDNVIQIASLATLKPLRILTDAVGLLASIADPKGHLGLERQTRSKRSIFDQTELKEAVPNTWENK